ncbi:MAG: hypothetical protein J0I45_16515 [Bosea sp.]|nr:hypothetical protein [Bosea sp. (in: a-proteobacteria)]
MTDTPERMPIDEAIRRAEYAEEDAWQRYVATDGGTDMARHWLIRWDASVGRIAALRAARARGETHVTVEDE